MTSSLSFVTVDAQVSLFNGETTKAFYNIGEEMKKEAIDSRRRKRMTS